MQLRSFCELAPRPLDWLWPGRLALGKLAILDGDPGLGKSLVTLDLCARLSTGRPFPDGLFRPDPGNALVLNAEDGAEDTVQPRLQALGADLDRVFVLDSENADAGGLLRLPSQLAILDDALARTRARLLVIDPLVAFFDASVQTSSDASVRGALGPLARLAARHGCAVLLVRHLNKSGRGPSPYRGGGSIGLLGACRSGWLVARNPKVPEQCVFAQVKNNLAAAQPSLAYVVSPRDTGPPVLSWLGPCARSADELLTASGRVGPRRAPRERAVDFLTGLLADGPRTSREVWAAAQEEDLSERTINRAKCDLGIQSLRVMVEGALQSYWLLRGQQLPDTIPPEDVPPDLEEWLEPLRRRFPPSTPLDEM
jgi:hypothetical protein